MITKLVHTLLFYSIGLVVTLIAIPPMLLIASLPAKLRYGNRIFFFFSDLFYRGIVFATMLPLTVIGKENIPSEPSIIVANHQSALDIPFIASLFYRFPHIWMFKVELTTAPILGFIARRMNVPVDVSSPRKAVRSIFDTLSLIEEQKRHLAIFPEGGRYTDGKIHDFFWGFAIIAKKSERPVVPVLIVNAYKAYPPGSFFLHRYPITLRVGKPFTFEPDESDEAFVQRVYNWFVQYNPE